jgi:hypothetical protein
MLPQTGPGANNAQGAKVDYLSQPFLSPARVQERGLEYGPPLQDTNSSGFLSGALAALGALGGYLVLGPVGAAVVNAVGGTTGAAAGSGLLLDGPAGAGAGAALGSIAGVVAGALMKARLMSDKEWAVAVAVFGNSLPPRDHIIVTDISGLNGRAFTVPGSALATLGAVIYPPLFLWLMQNPNLFAGRILMNMGGAFPDLYRAAPYTPTKSYPYQGMVLAHELTHAWQIYHQNSYGYLCSAVSLQTQNSLGSDVYAVQPGQQWGQYNLEQQATLVDLWYGGGMSTGFLDPYYRYITANIRPGNPDATSASAMPSFAMAMNRPNPMVSLLSRK